MAYEFYFGDMQLPVTPGSLELKINNQNKTANLINGEEINILEAPGLTDISLELMLPQVPYPFAHYEDGFQPADYYLAELKRLKTEKIPFQLICIRESPSGNTWFDTNMKVSLEDYKITEKASNGPDVTVAVQLKQYREYGTKIVEVTVKENQATVQTQEQRPQENAAAYQEYEVQKGDCLWNIAKKLLGNGARYPEIYNLNRDKISNPNLIYPKQVLMIP